MHKPIGFGVWSAIGRLTVAHRGGSSGAAQASALWLPTKARMSSDRYQYMAELKKEMDIGRSRVEAG